MVKTIDGIWAARSLCLYSSGISYAIVKNQFFQQISAPRVAWQNCAKVFTRFPNWEVLGCFLPTFQRAFASLVNVISASPAKLKSSEYRHKYIYPNGIHASHIAPLASPRIPVLALFLPSTHSRLQVPRVAPPLGPLLQLTFCGTRLRSTGQFRLHLPSLPDRFCACGGVRPVRRETTRGEI